MSLGGSWSGTGNDGVQQSGSTPQQLQDQQAANTFLGQLGNQKAGAEAGPQQYADQTMNGVQANSQNIASSNGNTDNNTSLGGSQADAGLGAAINAKSAKGYNQNLGAVQRQANFNAQVTNISRSNDYANTQVQLANAQRGVASQMNQISMQAQAAQYALVGSMFKGAGSIAGVAAGGGFGGGGGTQDISPGTNDGSSFQFDESSAGAP
jgi:hypothetical protein